MLGTLDEAERIAVEARLQREPALADAVLEWQTRLSPLDVVTPPFEPPVRQLDNIFARIDAAHSAETSGGSVGAGGGGDTGAEIIQLKRKARVWRMGAMLSGAIAAALAVFMVFVDLPSRTLDAQPQMVALLQSGDAKLAYVASINTETGKVSLKRVGAGVGPQPGKSHELWAIGGGRTKPESLGVINAKAQIPVSRIGPATAEYISGITLAVSLEPEGGSPTGQPTGPVLFTGKCVELPEV